MQYFQEKNEWMLHTCLQFQEEDLLLPSLPANSSADTADSIEQSAQCC